MFNTYLTHRCLRYCELPHCGPLVNLHPACEACLVSNFQRLRVFPLSPLAWCLVLALSRCLRTWEALGSVHRFAWIGGTQTEWEFQNQRGCSSASDWLRNRVGLDGPCFNVFWPFWPSCAQAQLGSPGPNCLPANSNMSFSETQYKIFSDSVTLQPPSLWERTWHCQGLLPPFTWGTLL